MQLAEQSAADRQSSAKSLAWTRVDAQYRRWPFGSGGARVGADTAARDQIWGRFPSTGAGCFQVADGRVGRVGEETAGRGLCAPSALGTAGFDAAALAERAPGLIDRVANVDAMLVRARSRAVACQKEAAETTAAASPF